MSLRLRAVRSLAVALAAVCWSQAAAAQAGDATAEATIDVAINQHYFATDFDQAEALLREALMECGGDCSTQVQARIWTYLGIVLFNGKNDAEGAKDAFTAAVQLDPSVRLDDKLASAETQALFEEAGGGQPPAPAAPQPAAPPKEEEEEEKPEPVLRKSPFGRSGQFVLSAERLSGYFRWNLSVAAQTTTAAGPFPQEEHAGSSYALLGRTGAIPTPPYANPYASPYLGIDYFVIDNLSIGGAVTIAGGSMKEDTLGEDVSINSIGFQLRAGYVLMFSPMLGVWPRAGFSMATISVEETTIVDPTAQPPTRNTRERSYSFQDISLDVPLVVTPVNNFGFMLGPVIDIGFAGNHTFIDDGVEQRNTNSTFTNYGASAGIFGYL